MDVFDCAERYKRDGTSLILICGKDYGSGSSRDWAAKGPFLLVSFQRYFCFPAKMFRHLQGIKAVIAESFERIHRSNLVGMGIIPLQFIPGQNADSFGLTGRETYNIELPNDLKPGQIITVKADSKSFDVILRFDTDVDLLYFRNGGILNYMVRSLVA